MFTTIVAISSQICIPMPYGVPMTLQTFAIPLSGVILGKRSGTIAVVMYVLLGAVGVPVFSGFGGGIGRIFGMTGGFILALPFMAFFAGLGAQKGTIPWLAGGLALGIIVEYTFGTLQYMLVTGSNLQVGVLACVVPFMPTEIVKAALVGTVGVKCRQVLVKSGLVRADVN